MITKLTRIGDEWALVLDPAIVELFKIDANGTFELTTNGGRIFIKPTGHQMSDADFDAALAEINRKHGTTLQRLAK